MTVYVDKLVEYPEAWLAKQGIPARLRHKRWCHLFVTEIEALDELHELAATIGMKRQWFQGDHYDLVPSRREQALACGAVEATKDDMRRFFENVRRRLK
jgi:hypothetical protein